MTVLRDQLDDKDARDAMKHLIELASDDVAEATAGRGDRADPA